jgi:uncharacterized membrane protein
LTLVAVVLAGFIVIGFILLPPPSILGKADVVGYAICHRIPERSFVLGDRHFPLCARCTGTFLGVLIGMVVALALGRRRAARMAPVPILAILIFFMGFWAFDGLNSYMHFFPNAPTLYEPQNWLRMTTGTLNGLALFFLVFPVFNFTLWRDPMPQRVLRNVWELLATLPLAALVILGTQSGVDLILYPLAILSSAGVVLMLIMINAMIAVIVLGREGYASTWKQAWIPILVGFALALVQISLMAAGRAWITAELGLPF